MATGDPMSNSLHDNLHIEYRKQIAEYRKSHVPGGINRLPACAGKMAPPIGPLWRVGLLGNTIVSS